MATNQSDRTDATVKQGVDTDEFDAFLSWLAEHPDRGYLTLRAEGFYDGVVGRSTVHTGPYDLDDETIDRPTRQYTLQYGAWKEVEAKSGYIGATDRMEPVETALSALTACLQAAVSINALRHGYDVDDIHVDVEAVVDPRVLFGVKDASEACLQTIRADIEVDGEALSEADVDQIKSMATRSPVHELISADNNVILTVNDG